MRVESSSITTRGRLLTLVPLAVGAALASAAIAVAPATARSSAASAALVATSTQRFGYDGGARHFFTVPAGVHRIHLTAWGGSGGSGGSRSGLYAAPGGLGAQVDLDAPVDPGDSLLIEVGQHGGFGFGETAGLGGDSSGSGQDGGPGGNVNASGMRHTAGGGGGGGTRVRDASASSVPLVVAGGGGGGGGGGELAGYNGGQGGNAGSAGFRCDPVFGPGVYGSGLTGGAGGQCSDSAGPRGSSGSGEAQLSQAGTGGGGGGGYFGGDGGAAGGSSGGGGGGGGAGTSFWSGVTSNVVVSNGGPGDGGVVVSWTAEPVVGTPRTATFRCCAQETFVVPAGVRQLTLTGWGGSGGTGGGGGFEGLIAPRGGLGALIRERVDVDPGDRLAIGVGGAGSGGLFAKANTFSHPYSGGAGGATSVGEGGGDGGSVTVADPGQGGNQGAYYAGGTGGGGGAGTLVLDTSRQAVLLNAGGGGGGGGDSDAAFGSNGGPGGNAGDPLVTGNPSFGDGYFGSGGGGSLAGTSNGRGGAYASAGTQTGQTADDSTEGNVRGTGGGGGGGEVGGGAGGQCTGLACGGTGGGGAAGSSSWDGSAHDVTFGNSLGGDGGLTISWLEPAQQAIAFTSTPPGHPMLGGSYAPTATGGGSGNPVVFSIDSASTAGACSIDAGTVTFTGLGSCVIDADQAGEDEYLPAPRVQQVLTIAGAPQQIAFTSTPPAQPVYGGSYAPTATGGGSGNPVVFAIDPASAAGACSLAGGTVSFTGTGSCVIDADQAGGAGYLAAPQAQQALTIARAPQVVAFTSTPPATPTYGGSYAPAASGGGSGNPVVLSIDPSSGAGACSLAGGAVSFTGAGSCVIDADQAGNENYLPANRVQQALTIARASQAVAFTSTPPAAAVYGGTYTPAASGGGSGNPVVFSIDPASSPAACSVAGGTVSFVGVGSCVVVADQAGDEHYLPAEQARQEFVVAKATLTVAADGAGKEFGDPVPPLTATIGGFVGGETLATSGVTGEPACTTTATAASPGGSYPVTCTQGSLAAAHYAFRFAEGTLRVTFARTVTGSHSGPLTVARGSSVLIGPGAVVRGPLTVGPGGALEIDGATVVGPLRGDGAAAIRICGATVVGPTAFAEGGGRVVAGDEADCAGNRFTGPVRITASTGGVVFDRNVVVGPLTIAGNTGAVEATANTVRGKSHVQ